MIHPEFSSAVPAPALLRLRRFSGDAGARLSAMVEPTGTRTWTPDGLAVTAIRALEAAGRAPVGTRLVAATPRFGASVAMVAAGRGLDCTVVITDDLPRIARHRITAYGADLLVVPTPADPSDSPVVTQAAARRYVAESTARVLVDEPGCGLLPPDDAFRMLLATAGVRGRVHVVAAGGREAVLREVVAALTRLGGRPAPLHLVFDGNAWSGTGNGAAARVTERQAFTTARRLARQEGILCRGHHGGAALVAALECLAAAPPEDVALAIVPACDDHDLETVFDPEYFARHFGDDKAPGLTAGDMLIRKGEAPIDLVTLAPDATVAEAIRIMQDLEVSQIPICSDDRVVGTVREVQVIDLLLHARDRIEGPVEAIMEDALPEVPESGSIEDVQAIIAAGSSAVLVRRADGARSILTKYDLIHGLARGTLGETR